MKVEEVIEKLEKFNPKAEIIFYDWKRGTFMEVSSIWGESDIAYVQVTVGDKWYGN